MNNLFATYQFAHLSCLTGHALKKFCRTGNNSRLAGSEPAIQRKVVNATHQHGSKKGESMNKNLLGNLVCKVVAGYFSVCHVG